MALTLEATLTIPVAMAITVGILCSSAGLYRQIEQDSRFESDMLAFSLNDPRIWVCETVDANDPAVQEGVLWRSRRIAVNPVREKNLIALFIDTTRAVGEIFPAVREWGRMYFEKNES